MSPTLHFHPLKVRALARHHDCGRNKSGVCARWQYISRTIGSSQLWKSAYPTTSTLTTMSVLTRAWPIAHPLLFISQYL